MKRKIIILGSTGSIGKYTFDIIKKNKKDFDLKLLSTNKNVATVLKQAKALKVKNIIISDKSKFLKTKKKYKKLKINFYNDFSILDKIFRNKEINYTMSSIVGIPGLSPSLKSIKFSQNIAIVNKESLVCGWNLINRELKKYKTNLIPIDSEHFSINQLITKKNISNIKCIYITASGGPFYRRPKLNKKYISVNQALSHPNWKMGRKISIDSATMMNKLFEVIEAKNIFNLNYDKIKILIHPKSYIHAIIEFKNGLIKFIAHNTSMLIPIYNSIYNNKIYLKQSKINFEILNNLELKTINKSQFPLIKILKKLPKFNSLYETALVLINDYFVNRFLKKKINYNQLIHNINKYALSKEILKLRSCRVKNISQIKKLTKKLRFKSDKLVYKY